jgi:fido (protein-threonine AMPylation protein)
MPAPNEKLAKSLKALQALQSGGRRVFQSKELRRVQRERLLRNGFVQEIIKGWLISSSPSARKDDSTRWYASFWEFCARYCDDRFGDQWHLSPEQSLLLHAENTVIPKQVIIYTTRGTNNEVTLPFGTSLYDLKQANMPAVADMTTRDGLRLYSPAAALVKVPEAFFSRYPIESQIVLAGIGDVSEVLRRLLEGGHSVVAGRLAGAFRRIGRAEIADEIVAAFRAANYSVRETDPFVKQQVFGTLRPAAVPIVGRIQAMWQAMRGPVIAVFPRAPGLPKNRVEYLKFVDEIYESDAYHSLSIEGYSVTQELIARVRRGDWDPDRHEDDRKSLDALTARGYWQAFQLVKKSIGEIIGGTNPGAVVRSAHRGWYRELFEPCVAAGLLGPGALAGYRNDAVYIRTSRYVPPRWEAARDAMPAFFDLVEQETEPSVRAVLGHWLFAYIHPYQDGNGRMARFIMNAMLASGGYPWTVVPVEHRDAYLAALDRASIDLDIGPFAAFIADRVTWTIENARSTGRRSVVLSSLRARPVHPVPSRRRDRRPTLRKRAAGYRSR